MVIITDKMKEPVNDNPVKFLFELGPIINGIFPNGINTDEKVAGNDRFIGIIERDDIRKVIVAQILKVDFEDVRVGAKDYIDFAETAYFAFGDQLKPGIIESPVFILKLDILKKVPYHKPEWIKTTQIYNKNWN